MSSGSFFNAINFDVNIQIWVSTTKASLHKLLAPCQMRMKSKGVSEKGNELLLGRRGEVTVSRAFPLTFLELIAFSSCESYRPEV